MFAQLFFFEQEKALKSIREKLSTSKVKTGNEKAET